MRKIIAACALLLCALLLFSACGRVSAAKRVDNMINALEPVGLDSGDALKYARGAYEKLSKADKAAVKSLEKLEKAEAAYENYLRINREIAEMLEITAGDYSDAKSGVSYLIQRAEEILQEYRKMSSFEKKQIRGADEIKSALETMKSYEENAKAGAATYVKAFLTLHAAQGDTVTGVFCVKNLRGGEEYHYYALTYRTAAEKTRTVYSTARCTVRISTDEIVARPDIFFADAPVSADTDAVKNGNVTLDTDEILALAQE